MTFAHVDTLSRRLRTAVGRASGADPADTAARVLDAVMAAVPGASAGALLLMNPHTGLFWSGAVTALPAASCHPFFEVELSGDTDSFRRMATTRAPARALRLKNTNPALLDRVVEPFGFTDEVRAVLPDGAVTWGGVSLWRGGGMFTADDEALLDSVAATAGAVLRGSVVAALDRGVAGPATRGMLLVEDGRVVEARLDGLGLGQELTDTDVRQYRHVDHLAVLATADPGFSTVIRTADGRWISAHGIELAPGRVAVTLTAATPAELLGARVAGSGLSVREIEVTRLLCRGLSDAEIAAELFLSPHTVHDHVRAIRAKLGVRSRAAVVSLVFTDAYFDAFLATAAIRHAGQG
ncbi:response regulator transcription factor [Actinophytocola sp. NPDC049390]|uniref:response regulator transcription factor n=1 Tax=Actinophytocola sp. NPDC049390 TaxID=3363894 RepID=UPI0037ADBC0D